MANGIVRKLAVSATEDNAINRAAVHTIVVQNGMVMSLGDRNTDGTWDASTPATATLGALWMAADSGENVITDANGGVYNVDGTSDPSLFSVAIGRAFSIFKPQVGDIVLLSTDAVGTYASEGFLVAADGEDKLQASAAAISGLSLKVLDETSLIGVPSKTLGGTSSVGYRCEVVAVA